MSELRHRETPEEAEGGGDMEYYGSPRSFGDVGGGVRQTNGHSGHHKVDNLLLDVGLSSCSCCNGNAHRNHVNNGYLLSGSLPPQLYKYDDLPGFLKGNPFIRSGYTSQLSYPLCFKSVCSWNNETVNVWSHLMGALMFVSLLFYDNFVSIPRMKGDLFDHLVLTLALTSFIFCLMCSAGYHTFGCHSEHFYEKWLAIDLTGISIGVLGCYLPGVYYAFYCMQGWRNLYMIVISALFGAVLIVQSVPQNSKNISTSWFFRQRILLYVCLIAYGIIPTVHWVYLTGGLHSPLVVAFLPKVVVVYLLAILAFFFYISKFPERVFPGRFDFLGSSHQIWHVIVLVVFLWWYQAGREILEVRLRGQC